ELNVAANLPDVLLAPAAQGQTMGSVKVSLQGQLIAERPLIALQSVAEGGLVSRTVDAIKLMFQ
ncbi:MAG: hypothetical protein FD130_1645, partial [Halothiobacillaceae bacterium]